MYHSIQSTLVDDVKILTSSTSITTVAQEWRISGFADCMSFLYHFLPLRQPLQRADYQIDIKVKPVSGCLGSQLYIWLNANTAAHRLLRDRHYYSHRYAPYQRRCPFRSYWKLAIHTRKGRISYLRKPTVPPMQRQDWSARRRVYVSRPELHSYRHRTMRVALPSWSRLVVMHHLCST